MYIPIKNHQFNKAIFMEKQKQHLIHSTSPIPRQSEYWRFDKQQWIGVTITVDYRLLVSHWILQIDSGAAVVSKAKTTCNTTLMTTFCSSPWCCEYGQSQRCRQQAIKLQSNVTRLAIDDFRLPSGGLHWLHRHCALLHLKHTRNWAYCSLLISSVVRW